MNQTQRTKRLLYKKYQYGYYYPTGRHHLELHPLEVWNGKAYRGDGSRWPGLFRCLECNSYLSDDVQQFKKPSWSSPKCPVCNNSGFLPKSYVQRHEDLRHQPDYACSKQIWDRTFRRDRNEPDAAY